MKNKEQKLECIFDFIKDHNIVHKPTQDELLIDAKEKQLKNRKNRLWK